MTTRVITPPNTEPITLAEACAQARIEPGMDDTTITRYVKAATRHIEMLYGVAMITQTKELVMDCWPGWAIELADSPVQSITSIKYKLSDGSEQTLSGSTYVTALKSQPVKIVPAKNAIWPSAGGLQPVEAIAVRYVAGFGDATTDVPEPIRQAVALVVADWYVRREDTGGAQISRAILNGVNALMVNWR